MAEVELQNAKDELKRAENQAERCEQMVNVMINDIKAGVDARIA